MEYKPCEIKNAPVVQCCCTCIHQIEDFFHCAHDKKTVSALKDSCICSIRRGWICNNPELPGMHSNWPEHSCGCEIHTRVASDEKTKEERA